MDIIINKKGINHTDEFASKFCIDKDKLEVKYGLPNDVVFCKRCVISNQRPNSAIEFQHTASSKKTTINIDEEGVCDACRVAEAKSTKINWGEREKELIELCDRYRKNDGSYDCMIPGSGGKDSFYQAHVLKYKYGMHPLTVTWAPHIYTEWGWKNFQAWLGAGFDNYLMTPNPLTHRLLTRLAVENLFHPFQPFMIGQKAYAPKMAAMMGIPLIFYGEDEAEYGNPIDDMSSAKRSWEYFSGDDTSEMYLGGVSINDLQNDFGVNNSDLDPYLPINQNILEDKKISVHYLGYYLPWHPQGAYYYAVENGGFQASPERTPGTYSKYNSIDDKIDDLHFYTTFIKFGIGRATYDASQEVRNDEINRDEAVSLVHKYDGEFPERFLSELFEYLSINKKEFPVASKMFEQGIMDNDYFNDLVDSFRSPHLWKRDGEQWKLRYKVT